MGFQATANWEIRATGNANNGGGFNDRIPGTSVDYSQQNASQLSIADLACAAGSVTVTSAAAGFTAAMVGNYMRIRAGANFTVGFYEIVQFNGVGSVNLDRVPVTGVGANGVAEVGGAQIQISAVVWGAFVSGNTAFVKSGTYAAHPVITIGSTTALLTKNIVGYDVARGDNPTGNNRPLIQMGANSITSTSFPATFRLRNIRIEGSAPVYIGGNLIQALLENVKIINTAVAGTVYCVQASDPTEVMLNVTDCEFLGTAGATSYGIRINGQLTAINSQFHDLTYGASLGSLAVSQVNLLFCIFNRIGQSGLRQEGASNISACVINNTFANCGRAGVQLNSDYSLIMNNTFSDCVTAGIDMPSNPFMAKNNNFFGCGVPVICLALYPLRLCDNNIYVSPQFVTPGSVYALQRTSGLIDRAFSMRLGV